MIQKRKKLVKLLLLSSYYKKHKLTTLIMMDSGLYNSDIELRHIGIVVCNLDAM